MNKGLVVLFFVVAAFLPVAASALPVAVPASSALKTHGDYTSQVIGVGGSGNATENGSAGANSSGAAAPFNPPSGYEPFKAAQQDTSSGDGSGPESPLSSAEAASSQKAIGQESLKSIPQNAAAQSEASVVPEQVAGVMPAKVEASGTGSAAVPAADGVKAESQQKSLARPTTFAKIARFFKRLFS